MIEAILPFLIAFVPLGAFELGRRVRDKVHVVMPYKDPVTLLLFLASLSPIIFSLAGHTIIEPTDIWYLSFVIAFLGCYSLAYIRGELDLVYVCLRQRSENADWRGKYTRLYILSEKGSRTYL